MKLLSLVLLLSSFSSLTVMEVVNSFNESCSDFFIHNENDIIIPTIFPGCQYTMICQRLENKSMFATVYDAVRRIPVYSAYTLSGKNETNLSDEWKIEPQLENIEEYRNLTEMIVSPSEAGKIFNQAVDSDYKGTGFTRGQVFPYQFAADQEQANSTFTLTNAAPQYNDSKQKWADQVEKAMLNEIKQDCNLDQNHRAYIVTGVVPGKNWISITRDGEQYEEGINIPSHFWSAYCCTNNKRQLVAGAYITKQESFNLRRPNIHHLNTELTKLYNKKIRFNVFPGIDCKKRKK
ncbi:endonuclease domain-containing 1 protein-like [Tachysurus fulvidraco]|uniref:endonuclease domain-containing 1 protein-like n=1 Tax=Tachysurus fulvidraco TaxID=1234273 RepID=UPI001FEE8E95|nr:endonuclease domain-containing 1 protein-like [Tachysurus fulvidraco]